MVVLVDNALDEPTTTVRIDLGVPNQPPDPGIIGIAQRPTDLRFRQFQLRVGFQRMHEIPSVQVENDRRGILSPRLGEGWRKIGRAERCDRLPDKVDALGLAYVQHRRGRRD